MNLTIVGNKESKITLIDGENYTIKMKMIQMEQELEFELYKSPLMEEWLVAYPPQLYKSTVRKRFVLGNTIVCDIDTMQWWSMRRTWAKYTLSNDALVRIMSSMECPEQYISEINDALHLENDAPITVKAIQNHWKNIPDSVNVASWHIHKASHALVMEELWKHTAYFARFDGITEPSAKAIEFQTKEYLRMNRQYVSTDFKRVITTRKVVMPVQVPTLLKNFEALVLTSTPQSENAGAIASLAIGTELDKYGKILKTPRDALSLTSMLCPFPQRMAANREVVMCAMSQALDMQSAEPPLVQFKL